jgi:hypothetical protein
MKDVYQSIKTAVDQVRIIDTHEHLIQEKERTSRIADPFEIFFSHYASSDLISSGIMLEELENVRNPTLPLEDRWKILEPFWENIQNTGYARAINIAVRDLYNLNGITKDTYKELASRMGAANKPGIYKWLLKEKSGIDLSIVDVLTENNADPALSTLKDVDRNFMIPVARFEEFILPKQRIDFENLGTRYGLPIHSFSDFVRALELHFEKASKIIAGIKIGLAYNRTLRFDKVSEKEAEEIFTNVYNRANQTSFRNRSMRGMMEIYSPEGLTLGETKPLQDFIVHKLIQLAVRKNLVIQIHTGLQEGNDNVLTNSDPTLLVNLFSEYKEAKFDIFHGAYPYTGELAALAKNFPNVYVDMCWLHIISPSRAREALTEWLDTVPSNKIFCFGGDYIFAEGTYGHSVIARENIARVITERVEEGALTEEQGIELAQKLLHNNAYKFFSCKTLLEHK